MNPFTFPEHVSRAVETRDHDGHPARALVVTQTYPSAIDDVWSAVTEPDRIPRWFLPVTGELRPGGRYQLEGHAGGSVLSCDPPRAFAVTWEYAGDVSWVEVALTEQDGSTTLELTHLVHVDTGGDAERWEQFGPGAVGVGWESGLLGLATHLAGAERVDSAVAAEWSGSEEGHEFLTRSSNAWGDAAVTAGEEESWARAAAARTTAAYTGAPGVDEA